MTIQATDAFAFGSGTVSTTALSLVDLSGLTTGDVEAAGRARITVAGNPVRYRYDGTAPTAAVGHYLAANGEVILVGRPNLERLSFIRAGGADAELSVTLEAF